MINENCPNYKCKDCKHFGNFTKGYCNKRIDHKQIEFAVPWFKSSPEEVGFPCSEFEPSEIHVWDLKNYWTNWENWYADYKDTWLRGKDNSNKLCYFTLNGDRSVRYGVLISDYIYGTMIENNKLKAIEKMYYKRTKDGFGYKLIREKINGIDLNIKEKI